MVFNDDFPMGPHSHNPRYDGPPADPADRFEWRINHAMRESGRERSWVIDKLRKSHADEHAAYMRAAEARFTDRGRR